MGIRSWLQDHLAMDREMRDQGYTLGDRVPAHLTRRMSPEQQAQWDRQIAGVVRAGQLAPSMDLAELERERRWLGWTGKNAEIPPLRLAALAAAREELREAEVALDPRARTGDAQAAQERLTHAQEALDAALAQLEHDQAPEQMAVDAAIERSMRGLPPEPLTGEDAKLELYRSQWRAVMADFEERHGVSLDEYLAVHGQLPDEYREPILAIGREIWPEDHEPHRAAVLAERARLAEITDSPEWAARQQGVVDQALDLTAQWGETFGHEAAAYRVIDDANGWPPGTTLSDVLERMGYLSPEQGLRDLYRTEAERQERAQLIEAEQASIPTRELADPDGAIRSSAMLDRWGADAVGAAALGQAAEDAAVRALRESRVATHPDAVLDEAAPADLWETVGRHDEVVRAPETGRGWQWWNPDALDGGRGWDPGDVDWTHYWGEPPWTAVPLHGPVGPVWTQGGLYEPVLDARTQADLDSSFDRYHDRHEAELLQRELDLAAQRSDELQREWQNRHFVQPQPRDTVDETSAAPRTDDQPVAGPQLRPVEGVIDGTPGENGVSPRHAAAERPEPDLAHEMETCSGQGVQTWADRWAERQAELPGEPEPDLPAELAEHTEVTPLELDADHDEAEPEDDVQPR
jgi:hypothetical protein